MYQGFKLSDVKFSEGLYEYGEKVHAKHRVEVRRALTAFILRGGALDASKMQEEWFPSVRADVFISHSHKDARTAILLAGWLNKQFNLVAFVDSCVWGFSDELLKQIDDAYCYQPDTKTYAYTKRNGSTSHVHMMLSVALSKMMDASECLIFLNTPSSIMPVNVIDADGSHATLSPWIYSEIAMTKLIRRKRPRRVIEKVAKDVNLGEALNMLHAVELDHLLDLSVTDLTDWLEAAQSRTNASIHPLDVLYDLKGVR